MRARARTHPAGVATYPISGRNAALLAADSASTSGSRACRHIPGRCGAGFRKQDVFGAGEDQWVRLGEVGPRFRTDQRLFIFRQRRVAMFSIVSEYSSIFRVGVLSRSSHPTTGSPYFR